MNDFNKNILARIFVRQAIVYFSALCLGTVVFIVLSLCLNTAGIDEFKSKIISMGVVCLFTSRIYWLLNKKRYFSSPLLDTEVPLEQISGKPWLEMVLDILSYRRIDSTLKKNEIESCGNTKVNNTHSSVC